MLTVGVDVGSVRRFGGFSWAVLGEDGRLAGHGADDPAAVGAIIVAALNAGTRVAVAIEAPLALPVPDLHHATDLGRARVGEAGRPWSAGAGPAVLATGLVQVAWLCRYIAHHLPGTRTTTSPARFDHRHAELFLAEALVSADGKPEPVANSQDHADAIAAAERLRELLHTNADSDVMCRPHGAFDLGAAAALSAGLHMDSDELNRDIIVAKARPLRL